MVKVKDIMTVQPVTLNEGDTMEKAAELFKNNNFHHVPVINDDGDLVGILSSTDLERSLHGDTLFKVKDKASYNDTLLKTNLVYRSMKKHIITINQEDSLKDAYKLLKENNFRCLPVMGDNKLTGIVTNQDLLDYFMNTIE
ncbi:MAG: CBS domain-containing protein [Saprospiraceae bacterium]|nr:CBS domain-containing protein [Bacteroidia bacterium]MBT8229005.1 CBS domain-containing protein [Bacteroidia bacterium]NNF22917.1 CBS domain-containing protein [Saprospiraceae bacterium]NNK90316.1 CBS domain-containing protein [Saprospiraceae bacterium]